MAFSRAFLSCYCAFLILACANLVFSRAFLTSFFAFVVSCDAEATAFPRFLIFACSCFFSHACNLVIVFIFLVGVVHESVYFASIWLWKTASAAPFCASVSVAGAETSGTLSCAGGGAEAVVADGTSVKSASFSKGASSFGSSGAVIRLHSASLWLAICAMSRQAPGKCSLKSETADALTALSGPLLVRTAYWMRALKRQTAVSSPTRRIQEYGSWKSM